MSKTPQASDSKSSHSERCVGASLEAPPAHSGTDQIQHHLSMHDHIQPGMSASDAGNFQILHSC